MSTVSMVKSRFQFAMLGSLERSTCSTRVNVSTNHRVGLCVGACGCSGLPYLAIASVDAGEVDFADEGDVGRRVRVLRAAVNLERVDAVLVDAL